MQNIHLNSLKQNLYPLLISINIFYEKYIREIEKIIRNHFVLESKFLIKS